MDKQLDLLALRDQIDEIDRQIVACYEKRMEISSQIADYKIATGKRVFDREREAVKIKAVKELVHNDFNSRGIEELYEQIMSVSRKLQYQKLEQSGQKVKLPFIGMDSLTEGKKVRVVFQGAEGSFSQAAMEQFFPERISSFCVETFRDAMSAIDEGSADFGVLPIENSTAGIVSEIYDLLAEFENFIVGEQIIPVEHCLLGLEGTDLSKVERVYAHPQALMQSSEFLGSYPWQQIGLKNNAFAAAKIKKDNDPTQVAVASAYAGQYYGLQILERGINQEKDNSTRFIVVTNQKVYQKDAKKISVYFEVPHKSGSLYHLLSHFIYNDLNMTRIESRPIPERNWEYRFFLDFEGNLADSGVKNALRGLREESRNLRILGNY